MRRSFDKRGRDPRSIDLAAISALLAWSSRHLWF